MHFLKRRDIALLGAPNMDADATADYRSRVEAQALKLREQRRQELTEQASTINTPGARIRIWERLHQVALPRTPGHKVLQIIAANTGLSLEEVRVEQSLRSAAANKDE